MMANLFSDDLVLRGGFRVPADVVERLLDLEGRGVQFTFRPDGSLRVAPSAALTIPDRAWLTQNSVSVKAAIKYCDSIVAEDRAREAGHLVSRAMPA
jgi:hypothetical protein